MLYLLAPFIQAALVGVCGTALVRQTERQPQTPPRPSRGWMRGALLVVAAVPFWTGILAAVGLAAFVPYTADARVVPIPGRFDALVIVPVLVLLTLTLSCVGGLLWCSVLRTYADAPTPVPPCPAPSPPSS